MATRRMISNNVITSAKFLRMPLETQALYFHLCLNADDDGVVEGYKVMKLIGASEDSLKILHGKEIIKILNEDLVAYVMDRNEHNFLRADRKTDSIYQELLLQVVPGVELLESKQRSDRLKKPKLPIIEGSTESGTSQGPSRDGVGKDRLGEDRIEKNREDNNFSFSSEETITTANPPEQSPTHHPLQKKKKGSAAAPTLPPDCTFDKWRATYPLRQGRAKALEYFNNKITTLEQFNELMKGTENYIAYVKLERARGFNLQYRQGSTFMNQDTRLDHLDGSVLQTVQTSIPMDKVIKEWTGIWGCHADEDVVQQKRDEYCEIYGYQNMREAQKKYWAAKRAEQNFSI